MSKETSPLLPSPITIGLWGTGESQSFERVSDVVEWAGREADAWADVKPANHRLNQTWTTQRSIPSTILQTASPLDALLRKPEGERTAQDAQQIKEYEASLRKRLNAFTSGEAISRAHPHFATMQAIAETDPNAAATLLSACLVNGSDLVNSSGQWDAVARIGATPVHDTARRKATKALRDDLSALKKNAEADSATLRAFIDQHAQSTKDHLKEHQDAVTAREELWDDLLKKCDEDWNELKRVYDEKLALLAPTEYWRTRATDHRTKAIGFAVAFALALTVALGLFTYYGISHLLTPGTNSTLLAVIPVLVPAFAGVWVLRILGRLLSENLAISQDAHERETMVKTFLALMRDETTGKSVVTDEDRRIILHALFRPSAVTATDDSPPLHWLESLRKP